METIRKARNGDVEIAYERFGKPGGEPLVLVGGLDGQMVWYDEDFLCRALADRGFDVVRYDNRDAGLSTHFGPGSRPAYSARAFIDDLVALQDELGWSSAHLFGLSMGGGIAQLTALLHPDRVRALITMGALPMRKNLFVASVRHMRFPGPFRHAFKRFGDSRDEQIRMLVHVTRMAAAPGRYDEEWGAKRAAESYDRRPPDPHARQRQLFARRFDLPPGGISGIKAPTLALHGELDPLVRASAVRAIAEQIPGARWELLPGVGHAPGVAEDWGLLVDRIDRHVKAVEQGGRARSCG
ncbi:alpha/beta hydrolase [Actinocorallia sp. B10E7]|uniref:alpha/beta fold hydrolase n=1 Tax=Actinocorallia sp. B10E7 TaxID=3153558 RepID=UPI00325C6BA6